MTSFRKLNAVVFLESVAAGLPLPIIPFAIEHLGGGPVLVTLAVAVFSFSAFVFSPIIGGASDSFGRCATVVVTFAVAMFFNAALFAVWVLPLIFFSRIVDGAMGGRTAVLIAWATDHGANDHAQTIGWLTAIRGIGMAVSPIMAGTLAILIEDRDLYYRSVFGLVAALLIIGAIASYTLKEDRLQENRESIDRGKKTLTFEPVRTHWYSLLEIGAISYGFGVILSVTALYVDRIFEWTATEVGWLVGLSAGSVVISRAVIATNLAKSIGIQRTQLFSFCASTLAFFLLFVTTSQALWVFAFTVSSITYGIVLVLSFSKISKKSSSNNRGASMGFAESISAGATVLSALMNGLLFKFISYSSPYGLAMIVLILFLSFSAMQHFVHEKNSGGLGT